MFLGFTLYFLKQIIMNYTTYWKWKPKKTISLMNTIKATTPMKTSKQGIIACDIAFFFFFSQVYLAIIDIISYCTFAAI